MSLVMHVYRNSAICFNNPNFRVFCRPELGRYYVSFWFRGRFIGHFNKVNK